MKNILHVVNIPFVIHYFLGDQLSHFTRKGYNEYVICSPSSELDELSQKYQFKYKEIGILRKISIVQDIKAVYLSYKYMKEIGADIVVGHTPKGALIAMIASFLARVPNRIFFRHGLAYETARGIKRFILISMERITSLFSTQVVCVSPYLIERSQQDKLTSPKKMKVLNLGSCNGVDCEDKFNPSKIIDSPLITRQSLNISPDAFVVGYTGRIVRDKGIHELVEAFCSFNKKFQNSYLLLIGPEEEKDALSSDIKDIIKKHPHIITTGLIKEHIEYYYSIMDVLVLATYREGFGTSILEASAMSKPVLTTSHTGSKDAIINNVTGYYINLTPEAIEDKLKFLYDHPEEKKKLGENGRSFICKNFEEHIIWDEIEKLYK